MPQTIETTVYTFDELSDSAKEKARNWWREGTAYDDYWHESVYEDAKDCARIIGIEIDNIYFSGFSSQGDGACFEGSYCYAKGSVEAIKQHAPQDTSLHRIARELAEIQRGNFYALTAKVKHVGRYYHEFSTEIEVYDRNGDLVHADTHDVVVNLLRDYMRWIYRQLEHEYDWQNADEQVDENIRINEYTFTKEGKRF